MSRILVLIAVAACTKPAGGPLRYTFDNAKIATVPLDKKQTVTEAQQQHDLARLQRTRAVDDFHDAQVEVELAAFQAEHDVLVSQLVATRAGPITTTGDSAALARKASAAKVAFTEARRAWLDRLVSSTLFDVYAAQARLELERAKVAQANSLTPAGFDLGVFETQVRDRTKSAQDASALTDQEHKAAEARLAVWIDTEHAFLTAIGFQGPAESDRAKQALAQPDAK